MHKWDWTIRTASDGHLVLRCTECGATYDWTQWRTGSDIPPPSEQAVVGAMKLIFTG